VVSPHETNPSIPREDVTFKVERVNYLDSFSDLLERESTIYPDVVLVRLHEVEMQETRALKAAFVRAVTYNLHNILPHAFRSSVASFFFTLATKKKPAR